MHGRHEADDLFFQTSARRSAYCNSHSSDLERQYKSCISALDKSIVVKDKEIGKLTSAISQAKKDKNDLKKDLSSVKKIIKELDNIIYAKDQTIIAYNKGI